MARQSERLISLGYYDDKAEKKPRLSYKENLKRIFHKKRRSHFGSPDTLNTDPAVDQTPTSATLSNTFMNDLELVTFSDISQNLINDEWEADQTIRPVMDERGDQPALDTTESTAVCDKKFLLRCVSMCIVAILLCFSVSLNGGRYSDHWESVCNEFESLKEVQANLKQLQEDLIQMRRKLLPKGLSMPNFALESQGARVVHADPSQNYRSPSQAPLVTILGIPVLYPLHSPRTVIQSHTDSLVPGRCWCFAGQQGKLFIFLSQPVIVSHVTLGHISKEHSPYGFIQSAPQHFSVSGFLSEDGAGTHLGTFEYDAELESFQTFELPHPTQTYRYVMLQILNNWGNREYTCVYSFKPCLLRRVASDKLIHPPYVKEKFRRSTCCCQTVQ